MGRRTGPAWSRASCSKTPEKSYHAKQRVTDGDLFDNRLIFGDNLLALKALEQEFTRQNQIKALESKDNEKRRSLCEAQDKVDQQREELISNIEGKLTQKSGLQQLFTIRWHLQ